VFVFVFARARRLHSSGARTVRMIAAVKWYAKLFAVLAMMFVLKLVAFVQTGFCLIPLLRPTNSHWRKDDGGIDVKIPRLAEFMFKLSMFNYVVFGIPMPLFWVRFLLRRYEAANVHVPDAETQPVPECDVNAEDFSYEQFFEKYVKRPHPVVLRGFGKSLPAFDTFTVDDFLNSFGDEEVLLKTPERDGVHGNLRDIKNPGTYLHNSEAIFARHPELIDALKLDRMKAFACNRLANDHPLFGKLPVQMFVGATRGTGTPFHCANGYNWFFQLEGRKKWTFVDPKWIGLMVPGLNRGALYQTSAITDPNTVLDKYKPLWRVVPRYEVVLESGDVLLNPPWWWHCIENMSAKSLACATRWADVDAIRPILGMGFDTNHVFVAMQLFSPSFMLTQVKLIMAGQSSKSAFMDEHTDTKTPASDGVKGGNTSGVKVQHEKATRVTRRLLDNEEQVAYKAYYAAKRADDEV